MARTSYRVKFNGRPASPLAGHSGHIELAGIVDRPDQGDAVPVVVFSHCFTCNKDLKAIVRIARGLAERGIAVLRFDMTGLGGSQGDFSQSNFTTNVADLRAAIGFADQELGQVTALIGHSFGGAASLAVAGSLADQPARPRAVVTLAAPSDTHHLARLLAKKDPAIEDVGVGSVSIGGRDWTINRQMLEDLRSHELPDLIARINVPTMLFHSPVDETVGFEHAIRILGLIQSSPHQLTSAVSLVALDGADHLLAQAQSDIDFVIQTAAAFLFRYARP